MKNNDLLWWTYTWILFHTLAEKIKEEEFENEKENLIKYIRNICDVLPCPDCSSHATHLLKYYDYKFIKNKNDFKNFLFEFHNIVNKKRQINQQKTDILKIYEKAIFYKVLYSWKNVFNVNGVNSRMLTENMRRNRVKKDFITYINNNKHKFNL